MSASGNTRLFAYTRLFTLAAVLVLLDQFTKYLALLYAFKPIVINSFLSFAVSFNKGASFSLGTRFFSNHQVLLIVILSALIAAFLTMIGYKKIKKQSVLPELCIVSGAVSNLLDRINHGAVVDFIELSWGSFMWPVFNCADIYIVVGAGLVLFSLQEK